MEIGSLAILLHREEKMIEISPSIIFYMLVSIAQTYIALE